MKSLTRTILYFALAVLISASVAVALTITIMNSGDSDKVVLSADEYAEMNETRVFREIMDKIDSEALNGAVDHDVLIEYAANGMLEGIGDNYAAYYTAEEYEDYLSRINGEYNGIGVLVSQPDDVGAAVLDVYDDTPAMAAGIKTNDIITAVDGVSVAGMQLDELSAAINAEIDTAVELTLIRGEETLTVSVTSGAINIKRVEYALFNEYTGYIRIDMFTGNCVEEFNEAFKDLTERGMKSLVIDLRNNPGGSLSDVVDIADTLLGDCVIVTVQDRTGEDAKVYRSSGKALKVPLAIIVNGNSASASEILASAVQDNGAGVIVGMPTYGKGVVQTTMRLDSNGAWLKLTTDAYYTPNGTDLNGTGVTPDVEVDLPDDMQGTAITDLDQAEDAQLWAALNYVRDVASGKSTED